MNDLRTEREYVAGLQRRLVSSSCALAFQDQISWRGHCEIGGVDAALRIAAVPADAAPLNFAMNAPPTTTFLFTQPPTTGRLMWDV